MLIRILWPLLVCFSAHAATLKPWVIGGQDVEASDPVAKHAVFVYQWDTVQNKVDSYCSGSLVSLKIVLTAAHCLPGKSDTHLKVRVSFGLFKPYDPPGGIEVEAVRWLKHPFYQTAYNFDIGLIELPQDAPLGFLPILIAQKTEALEVGQVVTIAGYGIKSDSPETRTERLRKAEAPIYFIEADRIIIDQRLGHGGCVGDSGGPVIAKNSNQDLVLIGVTRGPWPQTTPHCHEMGLYGFPGFYQEFIFAVADAWNIERPLFSN